MGDIEEKIPASNSTSTSSGTTSPADEIIDVEMTFTLKPHIFSNSYELYYTATSINDMMTEILGEYAVRNTSVLTGYHAYLDFDCDDSFVAANTHTYIIGTCTIPASVSSVSLNGTGIYVELLKSGLHAMPVERSIAYLS